MREDVFIIWGNGLNHLEAICDIIREDYGRIYFIRKIGMKNLEKDIQTIYKCDTVPFEHLVAKTRYLLNSPNYIYAVTVVNENPDERYYGEGIFRHIQCAKIKATKEKIRNLYNPKYPNGRRTEEHVVHATDYQSQTDYYRKILSLFPWQDRDKKIDGKETELKLLELLVHNPPELWKIRGCAQCRYIIGKKDDYRNYILKHIGIRIFHDHLPGAYDKLIKEFDINKCDPIVVDSKNIIIDGTHRACILLSKGITTFKGIIAPS